MPDTHAHELLHMINEQEGPIAMSDLSEMAMRKFGQDATFHACVGNGLSFDDIIQILLKKGKIEAKDGMLLQAFPCNH